MPRLCLTTDGGEAVALFGPHGTVTSTRATVFLACRFDTLDATPSAKELISLPAALGRAEVILRTSAEETNVAVAEQLCLFAVFLLKLPFSRELLPAIGLRHV